MPQHDDTRRQGLMDAADILRLWLRECNGNPIQWTTPNDWAKAGMTDCIEEIETMAQEPVIVGVVSDPLGKLTNEQRACLAEYESATVWSCVAGLLILVRPGRCPEIIDEHGRYRTPLWQIRSEKCPVLPRQMRETENVTNAACDLCGDTSAGACGETACPRRGPPAVSLMTADPATHSDDEIIPLSIVILAEHSYLPAGAAEKIASTVLTHCKREGNKTNG